MLGDEPVRESKPGSNIVVHLSTRARERVVGNPVRASPFVVGLVLEQLHDEIVGAPGQHLPHRSGLVAGEIGEDGI